jgi:light-regulated signal transduction histidine kinase (bacteriophytochrome)
MRVDKISTVDLQQVIEHNMSEYSQFIQERNAKILCVDMPVIDAVPAQMHQLFGHLISNALKFTSTEIAPLINISCYPLTKDEIRHNNLDVNNRYHHIQVKDNGIGFHQESADRIFNICQRLHSKDEYDGTGVGLAICKKIIANHNGKIFASSRHGHGTTVHLLIPKRQNAERVTTP